MLPHDYKVTMLFYTAEAWVFATISGCLLVGQFAVVWLRVLPYLYDTYGADSTFYRLFLFLGMPFGCFFFDALMFLGPFGLLPIVPMPEAMRLFVPACAPSQRGHERREGHGTQRGGGSERCPPHITRPPPDVRVWSLRIARQTARRA